mgnify:CR=1 FL=1
MVSLDFTEICRFSRIMNSSKLYFFMYVREIDTAKHLLCPLVPKNYTQSHRGLPEHT